MDTVNTIEAANILELTRQQVTQLIRSGKLKAYRPSDAYQRQGYQIKVDDVYKFLEERNAPITEKRCPRCKTVKPIDDFNENKATKDGHAIYCRVCRRELYQENKEQMRAKGRQYWDKNKETINKHRKESYEQNKEEIRTQRKIDYAKKRDKLLARRREQYATNQQLRDQIVKESREYRKNNPEKVRQSQRSYDARNRDTVREYRRAYREKNLEDDIRRNQQNYRNNIEERKRYTSEYKKANPDKRAYYQAKRRARKQGQSITGKPIKRADIIKRDNATCYICRNGPLKNSEIHLDHVIPLARGGSHTSDNIRVACVTCNCKKQNKTIDEVTHLIEVGLW